jgi:transposase
LPDACCPDCGGEVTPNPSPSYRHQVFELPKPKLDITEYQLFHSRCQQCNNVSKGVLPKGAPDGQMGPRLLSYVSVLSGLYHLSVRKIQRLLQDQYGTHFSTGLISEAQGRVSSMLTPIHQALHQHIKQAPLVHVDETTHNRNGEEHTRWIWLVSSKDAVFQQVKYFRNKDAAKSVLGEQTQAVVVSDQCPSYHWIEPERHQFCLAHIERNLQQMADYSGKGLTEHIGNRLVLLFKSVFRTQHKYEAGTLEEVNWRRRMHRLRRSIIDWLERGTKVPASRYAGRCRYILKYEVGLWVFLNHPDTPLTNNEAERCLRGSVIMRKICYGTSSDRGEKFRSRVLSVVETCKKRKLSPITVISQIITAVIGKNEYPDVFGLMST